MPDSTLYPMIPLRDLVMFPQLVVPLLIGRERSLLALKEAMDHGEKLVLVTQKDSEQDDPLAKHLYRVGTLVAIHQVMRLPDGSIKILVEGLARVKVDRIRRRQPAFQVQVSLLPSQLPSEPDPETVQEQLAVQQRLLLEAFAKYVAAHPKVPEAAYESVQDIEDGDHLVNLIASFLPAAVAEKQQLLSTVDLGARLLLVSQMLYRYGKLLAIEQEIQGKVREAIEQNQKEYYLREQLKVIQTELGEDLDDLVDLRQSLRAIALPSEHRSRVERELARLERLPVSTAEAGIIRNYLEWIVALPWGQQAVAEFSLAEAEGILNQDHYGLTKVKERILEFLAVRQLLARQAVPSQPPAILCLVGPPGVGKTSLAQSIARSLGRKLVRVSLGGVHDESEIRGHRRTYVGAMPGRILQALRDSQTATPVMLLDEIDKLGRSAQGDPAAALLEVLDPEQNRTFSDHFVEIPFDLSQIFFVCTANTEETIPSPLLDRMEIVSLGGYTETEKVAIARRYLIPKQIKQNGLSEQSLTVQTAALQRLIREYTREAGVRSLERTVGSLCRKVARQMLQGAKSQKITSRNVETYLGTPPYLPSAKDANSQVGICTGLAWTPYGGCTLPIEINVMPGKGKLQLTGTLGDVMKESAQAAFSYIRAHRAELKVPAGFPDQIDVHIHIPDGATPKDGPSAGIAMATALVSALTGRAVRHDVAMTGEITLRGRVLPIGGLKEKTLAASQMGIKRVMFPQGNVKDLAMVPAEVKQTVDLVPVGYLAEVLALALEDRPADAPELALPWLTPSPELLNTPPIPPQ